MCARVSDKLEQETIEKQEQQIDQLMTDPLTDQHRARIWCKVMRLTGQEGLEYMRARGYNIKIDRYHQLMTEINKSVNQRLLYEVQQGFIEQHFASIDMVENLLISASRDLKALEEKHDTKSIYAKIHLRDQLANLTPLMSSYKERTQYVLSKQLESRKLHLDVGAPSLVEPDTFKMTKEMAEELGITDYVGMEATGATPLQCPCEWCGFIGPRNK